MPTAISLVFLALLCMIAAMDLLYRRIPNRLVLALLGLWGVEQMTFWLTSPVSPPWSVAMTQTGWTLAGAFLVLLAGYALFCLGGIGAGDIKLVVVLCLWMGSERQLSFLTVTALAGGVLALAQVPLGWVERLLATALALVHRRWSGCPLAIRPQGSDAPLPGIPYGLAICFGVIASLFFCAGSGYPGDGVSGLIMP